LVEEQPVSTTQFLEDMLAFYQIQTKIVPVRRLGFYRSIMRGLKMPESMVDYLYSETSYDCSNRLSDYPELEHPKFSEYKNAIFRGGQRYLEESKV
jgi:hypothetical protein